MGNSMLGTPANRAGNALFPFFPLPEGVTPETARSDLRQLAANGVGGVCIEPSGNRQFCADGWWRQMDAVMDEARALGMQVWLQDEPSFPTGNANGAAKQHPELCKTYLEERHIDVAGPQAGLSFLIGNYLDGKSFLFYLQHADAHGLSDPSRADHEAGNPAAEALDPGDPAFPGPRLLCVSACRVTDGSRLDGHFVDLTDRLKEGVLQWDVPEGHWRVFILYTLKIGAGRDGYLNLLDGDAVRLLLDELYEPHWERYKADFGKTFAGFFSDEPEFGNVPGYGNDAVIGRRQMPLPWSAEAGSLLQERFGQQACLLLPALWHEAGGRTAEVRFAFMDAITRLYRRNFSLQMGAWCREHGCAYIGHVVEDMGNHARLGCGVGHYFRAMAGQDYAGIDVVLQQLRPGLDGPGLAWLGGDEGGEFFHYGLAKLASSDAHLHARKGGRAICEIFAADGLSTGIRRQKWQFDHMMVRGINHFIPAWRTEKSADGVSTRYGFDPQFRYNSLLAGYVNRMCRLLQGGTHVAPVAVLYHAESEWCGAAMPFEKPVRALLRRQIDCDVVPADVFDETETYGTSLADGVIRVNGEAFRALVIPYADRITDRVAAAVTACGAHRIPVFFVDGLPRHVVRTTYGTASQDSVLAQGTPGGEPADPDAMTAAWLSATQAHARVVALEGLADALTAAGMADIRVEGVGDTASLRCYRYRREEAELFLLFNESTLAGIEADITLPLSGTPVCLDVMENRTRAAISRCTPQGTCVRVCLHPGETTVVLFPWDGQSVGESEKGMPYGSILSLIDSGWRLSLADASDPDVFHPHGMLDCLCDVTAADRHPRFSGVMRYETEFWLDAVPEAARLSLGVVHETAEVRINGSAAGIRICPPYRFDVKGLLRAGANTLCVDVVNTLAHARQDQFSQFAAIEPSGLLGPVAIAVSLPPVGG